MEKENQKSIDAFPKTVRELLVNSRYYIDYYQREYRWETKQIMELMDDFEGRFSLNFQDNHRQKDVKNYTTYFLGSIIINRKDNEDYIIDGQQRLTSLVLLIIFLRNTLKEAGAEYSEILNSLVFSDKYGEKSFSIDEKERNECFSFLYDGIIPEKNDQSESIQNIVERYEDIQTLFPDHIKNNKEKLLCFVTWLIEKIILVKITAYSDEDAYAIFETMNDRGLSLTSAEMLKGYLLANIDDLNKKEKLNLKWKNRILELKKMHKDDEADFFKAWLRGKYAESIRERKTASINQDFERIGTEYHKWVRDNSNKINLITNEDFEDFVETLFDKYSSTYLMLRKASEKYTEGLEEIYYNAQNNLTLQYPVLLSPICNEDSDEIRNQKIKLVATYLDIYAIRRAVNYLTLGYSAINYSMFLLMKDIRNMPLDELRDYLVNKTNEMEATFSGIPDGSRNGMNSFGLNKWSIRFVRHILARITCFIERTAIQKDYFEDYTDSKRRDPFQIEHIWSNHYDQHTNDFDQEINFIDYRNRMGDLLLVPKSFNIRYSDAPYEEKLTKYLKQNYLASSLNKECYSKDPFDIFLKQTNVPFKPYDHFTKESIDERQMVYKSVCEMIWSSNRFDQIPS